MDKSSEAAAPSTSAPADAAVSPPNPAPIPQGNGSGAPDAETVSDSFRVLLVFARFLLFRNEVFFFFFFFPWASKERGLFVREQLRLPVH